MIYTTTLTQKGQVTIPIEIRKYLGLKPYEKVEFKKNNNQITIKKSKDFLSLRGSIKTKTIFNDAKADKKIANYVAKQYEKKLRSSGY